MTAFQSYLASPKIKRVLNRRPGEEGFSLIELVVVVAVLAILAAVAIPNFTSLSDDARLNSAKQTLVNMYKECEYNAARTGVATHEAVSGDPNAVINGVTFAGNAIAEQADAVPPDAAGQNGVDAVNNCDGDVLGIALVNSNQLVCTLNINLANGEKTAVGDGLAADAENWPQTHEACTEAAV